MDHLVQIRSLEPNDATTLYLWDNNPDLWHVSESPGPVSLHILQQMCSDGPQALLEHGQQRWMIEANGKPIGTVELFDYQPKHLRAGVGILIGSPENRNRGYGLLALEKVLQLGFEVFGITNFWATIGVSNTASSHVFLKSGFQQVGIWKQWYFQKNNWEDAAMFQKRI
jgi:diamine N-acetyltransferase